MKNLLQEKTTEKNTHEKIDGKIHFDRNIKCTAYNWLKTKSIQLKDQLNISISMKSFATK